MQQLITYCFAISYNNTFNLKKQELLCKFNKKLLHQYNFCVFFHQSTFFLYINLRTDISKSVLKIYILIYFFVKNYNTSSTSDQAHTFPFPLPFTAYNALSACLRAASIPSLVESSYRDTPIELDIGCPSIAICIS